MLAVTFMFANSDISKLETKCEIGDADACLKAGLFYDSENINQDKQKTFFKKACDLGNGSGCSNLATIYIITNDFIKAKEYQEKGCELNHPKSCSGLADIYKKGNSVAVDKKKAKFFYNKACKLGSKIDCSYAKSL